ncbi:MAG: HAD family hydrolase [Chloroflexi bacterium]|nr:HAD family hydrolase [Chloroflexota bacterium]
MISLPKALLLDLDNTVLAFDQAVEQSWVKVATAYAPKLEGITFQRLLEALLRSRDRFWADPVRNRWGRNNPGEAHRQVVRAALADLGLRKASLADDIARSHTNTFDSTVAPFPGALETLERLRQQGVRLALVSNGGAEAQRRKVSKFRLETLVDAIFIEGELGFGKPEARIFRQALERLGASPAEAWMAGDNLEHDVAPAQALGMTGIWVDWQGRGLPPGSAVRPDRVVRGIRELLP